MILEVNNLNHKYRYFRKEEGLKGSIKDLFYRKTELKHAVRNMNISIEENQILGFIGPNGAGKTTTLKILCGLIKPTNGSVDVLGFTPYKKQIEFKKNIAFMMGNKSQLIWDLPAIETFNMNRVLYNINKSEYKHKIEEMIDLFSLSEKLHIPVRKLSLGERMKMEFIASIIHNPKIVLLDEPTLGMDLIAQYDFRNYIKKYKEANDVTFIITSHNMSDIENLCERIIIIREGDKIYDGKKDNLKKMVSHEKKLIVEFHERIEGKAEQSLLSQGYNKDDKFTYSINIHTDEFPQIYTALVKDDYKIKDVSLENENLEIVIKNIFEKGLNQ